MSDVQQYLLTVHHNREKALSIAQNSARGLESKRLTLIETVQSLGEFINDGDATIRGKAIDYLSNVIGYLTPTFLSRQQIQVLCQFFCDRIEDEGALEGLRKLQALGRFNKDLAVMTFRAMLEHFQDLQIRPQAQRLQILELLNELMLNHRNALKELKIESTIGITDLVGGEKDPRNLMIVFSILKVVMVEWDISACTETCFESVFCYFPITFRPPPDDPYGITAQDLKSRLRDCIAASDHFAPYSFPQLVDKLDSTSPNVKKDVLQTIKACVLSYGITTISNYSIMLWDSLKFEILNVQEADLAKEALGSLQAIATRLTRGSVSTDAKTPLAKYLHPITKECSEHFQEPQHKYAKPAGQILNALGIASPVTFTIIVKAVVPSLMTLYQDADSIAKQRALLEVFVQILDSAMVVYGTPNRPAPMTQEENPLIPFKERLFELNSQGLMSSAADEVSFRVVALRSLLRLCLLSRFLQDNEIGMVIQYLDEIVLSKDSDGRDNLRKEAIQALVELSRIKPDLIINITFPAFMAKLPDSSPTHDQDYLFTLEGLAQLSVEVFVADTLIRRLLNKLNVVLQSKGPSAYPQAILSTLYHVLGQRDLDQDPNLSNYYEGIVVGLTRRVVLASSGKAPTTSLNEAPTLEILARLITIIVRALDDPQQRSVGLQIYSLFVDKADFVPVLFKDNTPKLQMLTMVLSTSLMAGVRYSILLQFSCPDLARTEEILAELIRLALLEVDAPIRLAILRQIGLLVNKFVLPHETEVIIRIMQNLVLALSKTSDALENTVRVVFWIAKGLVLRLAHTDEILKHLLNLLSIGECGVACARGFGLLLAPDEVLSTQNGAKIRLLAKQKVFSICVPFVATEFRTAKPATKSNYLVALSGILKHIPTEVVMPEVETLLPLLLQSLDLGDTDVKVATIQTLTIVSQENPKVIEGHIVSLISRLLRCVTFPENKSARVRLDALLCLQTFPGRTKDSTLLPYKDKVTRVLQRVLDDPRRDVRKEAVGCRKAWSNMDEIQSD